MRTRVRRWGNSLALKIPIAYAREIGLTDKTGMADSLTAVYRRVSRPYAIGVYCACGLR